MILTVGWRLKLVQRGSFAGCQAPGTLELFHYLR